MTEEQYIAIKRAAQPELMKIPGVNGVGLGGKWVNGQPTGEVAILVYVWKKKPPHEVPPDELIPREINGVKTDVIESVQMSPYQGTATAFNPDTKEYRPLEGGIQIQVKTSSTRVSNGTLGCMAKTNDGETVLLTNYHVLDGMEGKDVHQPNYESNCSNCCPTVVAKRLEMVLSDDVDGATAKIVSDVKIKPKIVSLGGVTGTHTITAAECASGTYLVKKRGRTTRLTQGIVTDIDYSSTRTDGWVFEGQIRVKAEAPSITVSQPGDSGSVFVNDAMQVVGLLWGGDGNQYGSGSPIQAVMDQLGITISTADTTEAPDEDAAEATMTEQRQLAASVLSELQQSEQGRRYVEYYLRHHAEIRQLVNTNRRVATAWHRNHGPVVFRSVIQLARDRQSTLPEEIEGRPLALCLDGILGAFLKYGSPALKKDIIMESPDASGLGGLSYEQLLERLGSTVSQ